MDAETALAYERDAQNWVGSRSAAPRALRRLGELTSALAPGARVADLGCGPGWYAAALARSGFAPVALDLSAAMLTELRRRTPGTNAVRGNLAALPFARGSLDGAIAFNTYQHLPAHVLPSALARLHDALRVDAPIEFTIGNLESVEVATQRVGRGVVEQRWNKDPYPGRLFSFSSSWATSNTCAVPVFPKSESIAKTPGSSGCGFARTAQTLFPTTCGRTSMCSSAGSILR